MSAPEVITKAFRMQLKPGMVEEYRRRHDELWPDLGEALRHAGIHDYSIFLDEESLALFAVLKLKPGYPIADLPQQPVMARWWDYMADIMEVEADGDPKNRPKEWALQPMFHFPG
jgi:L-rhamnose mutarotase